MANKIKDYTFTRWNDFTNRLRFSFNDTSWAVEVIHMLTSDGYMFEISMSSMGKEFMAEYLNGLPLTKLSSKEEKSFDHNEKQLLIRYLGSGQCKLLIVLGKSLGEVKHEGSALLRYTIGHTGFGVSIYGSVFEYFKPDGYPAQIEEYTKAYLNFSAFKKDDLWALKECPIDDLIRMSYTEGKIGQLKYHLDQMLFHAGQMEEAKDKIKQFFWMKILEGRVIKEE